MSSTPTSTLSSPTPVDTDLEKRSNSFRKPTLSPAQTSVTLAGSDDDADARLVRKIDLHILPFICVMYLLAFLDRVNISNAALYGLTTDLGLRGNQYQTALVIFFVPNILCEIPSNVFLKRLRPHVWLSFCMFSFGLVSMLQGFAQGYASLLTVRFFLGVFEAGMFPGCFYLLSMWYRRAESQKRFTFFFCSVTLAGAFGGLLASAIGRMDGICGYRGWRWIFILEGILTCVVAIAWFFFLPDFPEEARFLTPAERAAVRARLHADVGSAASDSPLTVRSVLRVFRDYKVLLGGLMYLGMAVGGYGYAYFAPTIIHTFNYGTIQTQLHSVPPWAAAFVCAMSLAWLSDRTGHRWAFSLLPALVAIAGFAILLADPASNHVKYGALFLAVSGVYASSPVLLGWFNANLAGHTRRAVGSAWQIGFGNVGGIIAAYLFPAGDGPQYTMGYATCLAFVGVSVVAAGAYFAGISVENARRERYAAQGKGEAGEGEGLGDLDPSYRYLL